MNGKKLAGGLLMLGVLTVSVVGCRARVYAGPADGPHEVCRTVTVRTRGDLDRCVTRCGDQGCRTRCQESARYARERRCWVE